MRVRAANLTLAIYAGAAGALLISLFWRSSVWRGGPDLAFVAEWAAVSVATYWLAAFVDRLRR